MPLRTPLSGVSHIALVWWAFTLASCMSYSTRDLHILHGRDTLVAADARRHIWIGYYGICYKDEYIDAQVCASNPRIAANLAVSHFFDNWITDTAGSAIKLQRNGFGRPMYVTGSVLFALAAIFTALTQLMNRTICGIEVRHVALCLYLQAAVLTFASVLVVMEVDSTLASFTGEGATLYFTKGGTLVVVQWVLVVLLLVQGLLVFWLGGQVFERAGGDAGAENQEDGGE